MNSWENTSANKTEIEINSDIPEIELSIYEMTDSVRSAVRSIEKQTLDLNNLTENIESGSNTFLETFLPNFKKIEDNFKTLKTLINKFKDLKDILSENNNENNFNDRREKRINDKEIDNLNTNTVEINLHEIKIELINTINCILETIPNFKRSLNAIESLPKDFSKTFVDININELENIEMGVMQLKHCKESILKFCER
ncbi:MAG: hypothetical protein KAI67_06500 [Candidatus Pacebacteria bacterium]|nr:hypothetical protein [Candidatus Paceibacterota bacterium]